MVWFLYQVCFVKQITMEKHLRGNLSAGIRLATVTLVIALLVSSCATRASFMTSTILPAAEGTVKVKKDNNANYAIDIEIDNIAEPGRLAQPKSVYVVWAETSNGLQNLGRLEVDKGLISGKLKASMETSIPYKPTRIFITAEDAGAVSMPGSYVVLNTNSF